MSNPASDFDVIDRAMNAGRPRVYIFRKTLEQLYDQAHSRAREAIFALERKENIEALSLKAAAEITANLALAYFAMLEIRERLSGVNPPKEGE